MKHVPKFVFLIFGLVAPLAVAESPKVFLTPLRGHIYVELKQLNLGFTTIVAGHWSPIHGPELIDQYLQLLAARR